MSVTGNNLVRAVATVGLSELETRVFKATYPDDDPPKAKHVEYLIDATREYDLTPLFDKRLATSKWNIVLKTLIVIHRLSIDGNEKYMKDLAKRSSMLHLSGYIDSGEGRMHHKFIKAYAEYLSEKVYAFKLLNVSIERRPPADSKTWAMSLSVMDLCKSLPALEEQFQKLLACQPFSTDDTNHPAPMAAVQLLIKDGFRLYSLLTVEMLVILEKFEQMTLEQTKLVLRCCQRFLDQNERFKKWSDKLAKLGMIQSKLIPKFDAIPDTFISLLQERVNKLNANAPPGLGNSTDEDEHQEDDDRKKQKKKKMPKKKKKQVEQEDAENVETVADDDEADDDHDLTAKPAKRLTSKMQQMKISQEEEEEREEQANKQKKKISKQRKTRKVQSEEEQEQQEAEEEEEEGEEEEEEEQIPKPQRRQQPHPQRRRKKVEDDEEQEEDEDEEDEEEEQSAAARRPSKKAAPPSSSSSRASALNRQASKPTLKAGSKKIIQEEDQEEEEDEAPAPVKKKASINRQASRPALKASAKQDTPEQSQEEDQEEEEEEEEERPKKIKKKKSAVRKGEKDKKKKKPKEEEDEEEDEEEEEEEEIVKKKKSKAKPSSKASKNGGGGDLLDLFSGGAPGTGVHDPMFDPLASKTPVGGYKHAPDVQAQSRERRMTPPKGFDPFAALQQGSARSSPPPSNGGGAMVPYGGGPLMSPPPYFPSGSGPSYGYPPHQSGGYPPNSTDPLMTSMQPSNRRSGADDPSDPFAGLNKAPPAAVPVQQKSKKSTALEFDAFSM